MATNVANSVAKSNSNTKSNTIGKSIANTLGKAVSNTTSATAGIYKGIKTVDIWGVKLDGVYAKFQSEFTTFLPNDLLLASDAKQFKYCTDQLKNAIENSPELRNKFSPRQLEQIKDGKKISGYTWNHNEEVGKMELVNEKDHAGTPHTGGRAIWGGGDECR